MTECVHGLDPSTCATCSPVPDLPVGHRRRRSTGSGPGRRDPASLTGFFELLDAPLTNPRWSWGTVRERDGVVFLRVWDDEVRVVDGSRIARVYRETGGSQSAGRPERLRQLDLVRDGAICYLVFCTAADPNEHPRKIVGFNSRLLARAGSLVERGSEVWIEVGESVPADQVMRGSSTDVE